jgi:FdrA protein
VSSIVLNEIRKGFYLDSVALMRLSREIAAADGVVEAALMMGTQSNVEILRNAGLLSNNAIAALGNDLILAVRAETEAAARAALDEAGKTLDRPKRESEAVADWKPRTIAAALRAAPDINLALISVPGEFAAAEARKALGRGLHVMMFSDNVTAGEERALKEQARAAGLLMMGPDCGTAIIGGEPLAFANRVRRGDIGIIGASGTGTQEVSSLISEGGGGISHAIGVGGRDLKREIGGITTLMAIDSLDADDATKRVVLVSKPPHPDVAKAVIERIGRSQKPFTVCFIGADNLQLPPNAKFAATLKEAAEAALGKSLPNGFDAASVAARHAPRKGASRIEGLYSGGTLCAEAQFILASAGRRVTSNAAIPGVPSLSLSQSDGDERILDLGADEYTKGRPHPMIDPSVRDEALRAAISNPSIAVVLVDLVIGYGAHADPAGHLAAAAAFRGADAPPIIASVCGTEQDPQVRSVQERCLRDAGILVAPSNADASRLAVAIAASA